MLVTTAEAPTSLLEILGSEQKAEINIIAVVSHDCMIPTNLNKFKVANIQFQTKKTADVPSLNTICRSDNNAEVSSNALHATDKLPTSALIP